MITSENKYIMIAYHCYSNAITASSFNSFFEKHRLLDCGATIQHLKDRNMLVDPQILDYEAITEYKRIIKTEWGLGYQLVPPHIHRINAA